MNLKKGSHDPSNDYPLKLLNQLIKEVTLSYWHLVPPTPLTPSPPLPVSLSFSMQTT